MAVDIANIPSVTSVSLGSVTTVVLQNSALASVTAWTMTSALDTQTAGLEDSSWTVRGLRGGAATDLVKFGAKGNQWPIEIKNTNTSLQAFAITNGDGEIVNSQATKYLFMGTLGTGNAGMYGNGNIGVVVAGNGTVGDCGIGTNVALANNATNGFAHMPRCETTGVMTGVPAFNTGFFAHKAAFCYNSVDHTFNVYDGTWRRTPALT